MSTYCSVERQRGQYAVRELCQVLNVAPSASYSRWQCRQRPASAWEQVVCRAFARHARRHGTRWLRVEAQGTGY